MVTVHLLKDAVLNKVELLKDKTLMQVIHIELYADQGKCR